ncbi:MAG: ABC transporter ATP-binding protein [Planctomycetes bacterium]|nr:ABC transporter ATP-binding protein [Planctomycetota bacterium]
MVASSVTAEPGGTIVISDVVKSFRHQDGSEVVALSGVDLQVASGAFVSLIGPSGCGKTTLLRLITGLTLPDSGTIQVDGEAIRGPDSARGLVFQNPLLFPWLTIHDNVAFGLRARKIYREKKTEVEDFLRLVGLERFGRSYPHQLSGGMAQRASLARALVNHPRVLLLDEPLGALDAFTRMNMQDELIRIWTERRTTMVMVTHDVDEAIYLSDKVVVMSPGPARIETVLDVPLPRPRARSNPDFLHLRATILKILNFGGQVREPNYQI